MSSSRPIASMLCLFLPALAIVTMGGFFMVHVVPEIERNERARVTREYRPAAQAIKDNPKAYLLVEDGAKAHGLTRKMAPGKWDYEVKGERAFVYYDDGNGAVRFNEVARVMESDYFAWSLMGTIVVSLLAVFMSVYGIVNYQWMLAERDDFLAATAHDLKNPLIAMQMLPLEKEADNLCRRALGVVRNLDEYRSRRRELVREEADLVAIAREAYSIFAADFAEATSGEVRFVGAKELKVKLDVDRTVQIFWNLFGNALKYAAIYGAIEIGFAKRNGFAEVRLCDVGKGMSWYERHRAFDRYYRARTLDECARGGSGLGLNTARRLARQQGGELTLSANVPNGCVFTLTLPLSDQKS